LRADLERRGALAEEVAAYLEVGHETSQLVVLKGRDLRFSRDLAFGTATMASALRQIVVPGVGTVDRTPEEAEALLRLHGIPMGVEEARFSEGVPLAAVSIMLRPALERLVRELWNSFDYCNEQFLGEAVTRVVLLGPGGRTRNLREHLAGVLKMPVTAADPEEGEASAPGDSAGAPAASAALASVRRGTLNFFSGSPSGTGPGWLANAVPAPAVAAAAALILVSIAAPAEWNVSRTRDRVVGLRADLGRLAAQSEAVARFREAREEEARHRALSTRLTGSQVVWSAVLRDLGHRVGPDVRLTAIEVVEPAAPAAPSDPAAPAAPAGRSLRLSGLLRAPRSAPEGALASLLRSLGASPAFDQVRLEGCERVSTDLSSFVVTVRLAEGSGS
jgi:Tfp pilus assembly protein PilN